MMVNGRWVRSMDLESGKVSMETHISVNGKRAKLKDTECISGKMVTVTKVSGKTA